MCVCVYSQVFITMFDFLTGLIRSVKKDDRLCEEYNDTTGCNDRSCAKICICRHLELIDSGCENDHTCRCSYPCRM